MNTYHIHTCKCITTVLSKNNVYFPTNFHLAGGLFKSLMEPVVGQDKQLMRPMNLTDLFCSILMLFRQLISKPNDQVPNDGVEPSLVQ